MIDAPKISNTPLCVDLDGTLLRSDSLYESLLALMRINPIFLLLVPYWLYKGKANLKRKIASKAALDPEFLPYDSRIIELLRNTSQRPRILCTASDELVANPIAQHIGLFEEIIASDGHTNMAGSAKAEILVQKYGSRNFDYVANAKVDLSIWRHTRNAWVVNAPKSLANSAALITNVAKYIPQSKAGFRIWMQAVRSHQWLKNLLVFVPLLAAHQFLAPSAISSAVFAFLAFSLCASGVYILNDLLDLPSDRQHPRKRLRAFASGQIPLLHGMLVAPLLTLTGFIIAWWCNPKFAAVLALYYVITLAYSLYLKRVEMLDVAVLAALYTIRIIGGAVAIAVPLSFWLLAFSMFIFLSLAMLKRYIELGTLQAAGQQQANGRGYAIEDRSLLQSLGGASGYLAVLVLALYINSPESLELYARPQVLWLLCPMLLYWISRAWSVAHRGRMDDDPVVFAATDRNSQAVMGLCLLIVLGAM